MRPTRRSLMVIVAAAALVAPTGYVVTHRADGSLRLRSRADIVRIDFGPYPEGPGLPSFVRGVELHGIPPYQPSELPLRLVLGDVPAVLPGRGSSCVGRGGATLTFTFVSGKQFGYGPDCEPRLIVRLEGALWVANLDARATRVGPTALTAASYAAPGQPTLRFTTRRDPGAWPVMLLWAMFDPAMQRPAPDGCRPDGSTLRVTAGGASIALDSCRRGLSAEMTIGAMLHEARVATAADAWRAYATKPT